MTTVRPRDAARATLPTIIPALVTLVTLATSAAACGDINLRQDQSGLTGYCEDRAGAFHFQAQIPPWKYNKEYRCTQLSGRECVGTWQATGRYVFVVSDIPFVNLDSEIVSLLAVERTSGSTASLAQRLIIDKTIGQTGSNAAFWGEDTYPREILAEAPALAGHEVLWRQEREFEGRTYNWYRRDVFLSSGGTVFHLEMYSIGPLDRPEFDDLVESFRAGASPDGAPDCQCLDEHDPAGPSEC